MTKTTYQCDRCGNFLEGKKPYGRPDQLWTVKVTIEAGYGPSVVDQQDWCRECVTSLHMICPPPNSPNPQPEGKPTLEEFIREIVREEVGQQA
jgi:hypothetical protein